MPDVVTIEFAELADLPYIKPLLTELMEATEDTEGFNTETAVENYIGLLESPDNFILVAKQCNRVLGLINFSVRRTMLHPAPSGLIDELVVTADTRGRGIGKRLVLGAIDKCRDLGCCEVEVSTEKSNITAKEFYASCGFEGDAVLFEKHI